MDVKIKETWLEALRSGKYKQGQNRLKFRNRFCCLGVLADTQGIDWNSSIHGLRWREHSSLPISKRYGLNVADDINKLQIMNDLYGKSFAEIADHIEANL